MGSQNINPNAAYTGNLWNLGDARNKSTPGANQQADHASLREAHQNEPQDTEGSSRFGTENQGRALLQALEGSGAMQRAQQNAEPACLEPAHSDTERGEHTVNPQDSPHADPAHGQKIYPLSEDYDRFGNRIS